MNLEEENALSAEIYAEVSSKIAHQEVEIDCLFQEIRSIISKLTKDLVRQRNFNYQGGCELEQARYLLRESYFHLSNPDGVADRLEGGTWAECIEGIEAFFKS